MQERISIFPSVNCEIIYTSSLSTRYALFDNQILNLKSVLQKTDELL